MPDTTRERLVKPNLVSALLACLHTGCRRQSTWFNPLNDRDITTFTIALLENGFQYLSGKHYKMSMTFCVQCCATFRLLRLVLR